MREHGAASAAAWEFSQAAAFWARFKPLTPGGRDAKEAGEVLSDRGRIEALLDETDAVLAWLASGASGSPELSRITYHLRRIPRLGLDPARDRADGGSLELVEIFQVKKFVANCRSICAIVPAGLASRFGLAFGAARLAEALDLGGSDAESFYVADAYDGRLGELRRRIAVLDDALASERAASLARAERLHGLDFRGLDFAVVPHAGAAGLVAERGTFAVESYDDSSYIVRLQPSEAGLRIQAERDAVAEEEKVVEGEVLARLSSLVSASAGELARAAEAVTRFDLALARAELAREHGLVRPSFSAAGEGLSVEAGRYLPCEWECARLGLRYTPLDLDFPESVAVVFGSNMGGKTVALETILFLQLLAQAGFHVPARRYATSVYPLVDSLGAGSGSGGAIQSGLSGFGYEIRSLVEAWDASEGGALLVFDEFARTTSSHEAEAILQALIEGLAARPGVRALFSTHFRGLARVPGARWLRVRGLDRDAARAAICEDSGSSGPVGERIRRINGMMRYGLVEDSGEGPEGSDAVAIASLLGLDCGMVARAEEVFALRRESAPRREGAGGGARGGADMDGTKFADMERI